LEVSGAVDPYMGRQASNG